MSWNAREYQRNYYQAGKAEHVYITLRLSRDDLAAVERAAAKDGVNRTEKIREFITWGLENG